MEVHVISAIFVDLAIIVTSQIKSLRNCFRQFSLVSELNFRFLRNLLKITLRKMIFYFWIPKFGYLRFQSPTPFRGQVITAGPAGS